MFTDDSVLVASVNVGTGVFCKLFSFFSPVGRYTEKTIVVLYPTDDHNYPHHLYIFTGTQLLPAPLTQREVIVSYWIFSKLVFKIKKKISQGIKNINRSLPGMPVFSFASGWTEFMTLQSLRYRDTYQFRK